MSDENDENWRERRLQQQQSAAAGAAWPPQVMNLPLPAWRSTAPRRATLLAPHARRRLATVLKAVYRRRLPARATTVYNNTKATELTQAGNGGVRRATRPQRATYEAPANREEPSYSYFTGCQPIKNDLKFSWPSHRKKMKSIILMMIFFAEYVPSLH